MSVERSFTGSAGAERLAASPTSPPTRTPCSSSSPARGSASIPFAGCLRPVRRAAGHILRARPPAPTSPPLLRCGCSASAGTRAATSARLPCSGPILRASVWNVSFGRHSLAHARRAWCAVRPPASATHHRTGLTGPRVSRGCWPRGQGHSPRRCAARRSLTRQRSPRPGRQRQLEPCGTPSPADPLCGGRQGGSRRPLSLGERLGAGLEAQCGAVLDGLEAEPLVQRVACRVVDVGVQQ
jgi:hypothetical protein